MTEPTTPSLPEGADGAAPLSALEQRKSDARDRLLKAQEAMAQKRAAGWKPIVLNPVEKAKANPGSVKMAVKAHCWTCCGAGADPGVKLHVRDCSVKSCNLWPHRPWQNAKGSFSLNEAGELVAEGKDAADAVEPLEDDAND
jgi:hypothetical protein